MSKSQNTFEQVSDDELVRRCRLGDFDSFNELYSRHFQKVLATCRAIVGTLEEAEDLAQETFLEFVQGSTRFEGDARFIEKLLRVARAKSSSLVLRKRHSHEVTTSDVQLTSDLQSINRSPGKEEEIFPNLKLRNNEEIKEAKALLLKIEEVKTAYGVLKAEGGELPKTLEAINVLLLEVDSAGDARSWEDVWKSAQGRNKNLLDISLVWREALIALMTGQLSFVARKSLQSCLRALGSFSGSDLSLDFEEKIRSTTVATAGPTASDFLSELHGLINLKPECGADLSAYQKYLKQQLDDVAEIFSGSNKLTSNTLIFAASSFNDQWPNGKSTFEKHSIKTFLLFALMTDRKDRQGLVSVIRAYLRANG